MPLVELRKCTECGTTAWHELEDRGPPAPCYWRCRECGERRLAKRISLSDDYALHRGHVQTQSQAAAVHIIDISVLGARLRFVAGEGFPVVHRDKILFNARLQPVGPLGVFHMATVRWVKNNEFGIAFQEALFACAADLSCCINS